MSEKNKAVAILKNAKEDLDAGKISRRDFNSIMMTFGAVAGYTLFNSFANAWTGARMRKSSGVSGNSTQRSLRFRATTSAYLSRAMTTPTNNKKFTWSGWFKIGSLSATQILFSASFNSTNGLNYFIYNGSNQFSLYYEGGGMKTGWITAALFRDPSAWYHVVLSVDTTQASYTTMVNIYINGVAQTLTYNNYASTYVTQNTNPWINSAMTHNIGRDAIQGYYTDSYLSEIYFVDGQTLTAASFGQTDATTGVWSIKKYVGTYGINGFYLPLSDTSSTTNLVKDSSGNANNWTANNISLTPGVTYDSMTDVPLIYGTTDRGNYCVLNPLGGNTWNGFPIEGNLKVSTNGNASGNYTSNGTIAAKAKTYFEVTIFNCNIATGGTAGGIGYVDANTILAGNAYPGSQTNSFGFMPSGGSTAWISKKNGAAATSLSLTGIANGDIIGMAYDPINGYAWVSKNGVWNGSGNPSTGANPDLTGVAGTNYFPAIAPYYDGTYVINHICNFGQRAFSYSAPTGFSGLHTGSLPTPTIIKPNLYFDIATYTGTAAVQTISTDGKGNTLQLSPDLVWAKSRTTGANSHVLFDTSRGVGYFLMSSATTAETYNAGMLTSFNTNGFSLGADSTTAINGSALSLVAWMWKKSATSGFDIVTYTGTGSVQTIAHSLGVVPNLIIIKNRTGGADHWPVYHTSLGNTNAVRLNLTNTSATSGWWNNTTPTSSVFSLGSTAGGASESNTSGNTYVAYLFAEVAGFSKISSYTGNGSSDGPFVYCGFRPRYILVKRFDAVADWYIYDTARDANNIVNSQIWANLTAGEITSTADLDILSNGFKIRRAGSAFNTNGGTHIFIAFAEAPFKYTNAR